MLRHVNRGIWAVSPPQDWVICSDFRYIKSQVLVGARGAKMLIMLMSFWPRHVVRENVEDKDPQTSTLCLLMPQIFFNGAGR